MNVFHLDLLSIGKRPIPTRHDGPTLFTFDPDALVCQEAIQRGFKLFQRINIVLHARAFGLCALGGVYNNFQDEEGLLRETKEALRFGFDGKTLIHPSQIEPVRQAYLPDPNALSQARDLVAAFENPINAGKGAISFNGRMVEAMHYHQALRLIARAKTS